MASIEDLGKEISMAGLLVFQKKNQKLKKKKTKECIWGLEGTNGPSRGVGGTG